MKYVYPAIFYKEIDGRYSVDIPDFGIATFGDDLPDAMAMAADAIAGRILCELKDGNVLPNPSSLKDITPEDESGVASLVYADLEALKPNHDETPVKKTLTIPSWLNAAAERKGVNFSATLRDALIIRLAK